MNEKPQTTRLLLTVFGLGCPSSNTACDAGACWGVEETMPLKLSLKPGEKFVLNGAVLANGDKRTSLVIQNKACVLREKDIMQPEGANTPARRIYLAIMMMYLDGEASEEPYNEFALRMTDFMGAISTPDILAACVDISRDVAQGSYYKALIACRKLFDLEQERLNYEP